MDSVNIVDYSRQQDLDDMYNREASKSYLQVIIGCGGIGYWLGIMLAMQGSENFLLIDGQKLEASNLNRIPAPQTWVGTNKAIALRKAIHLLRPTCVIGVMTCPVTEGMFERIKELGRITDHYNVWDCTDDGRIQQKIYKAFKHRYIKLGYEATKVAAYQQYDTWLDESIYQPGYRTSSANAMSSAIAAGLGIFYNFLGRDGSAPDMEVDIRKLVGAHIPEEEDNQQEDDPDDFNIYGEDEQEEQTEEIEA